jgi:hypothetical protein
MSGDEEHGLVSGRVGGLIWSHWGPGLVVLRPELGLDAGSETPTELRAELIEAWAGIQTDSWQVGFGATDRWIGPGRHGGLMLTDNAQAAPLASAAWEGRPWGRFGRVRVEVGAGWLDALRRDVAAPGWLLADLRWAPVPAFEMGATRMGIFGGAGRPAPEIGQLILPTRPHVDNDPDQALPDQDEIAALDGRLTLPLDDSLGGPLDWVELYIQYGGEDVIAREILTVPVPSLAGVANLYGLAVGAGPLEVDLEHARVLDDRFRWYTGHRIYHQGFTQAGRVMGHPSGGDSRTTSTAARWLTPGWGVEGSYEHVLRVGVAAIEGDNLQALMRDSTTHRVGLRGWRPDKRARWWHLDLNLERTAHPDFTPGAPSWAWRIAIGT